MSLRLHFQLPLDRFELKLNIDLEKPATGIFGPSGAGKTSLLETLAGLRRGALGEIRFGDQVWLQSQRGIFVPPERRGIGWAAQDGLLFPHLDVRGNLLAGAARARRAGQEPQHRLREVAHLLDLAPLLSRPVTTLSGGERQRVALGRALCSGPKLLLLDEPFAALDLDLRRALLPFLRRVRAELTVPMLLISHDPVEVQALCDDLVVLRQGKVIAHDEPRKALTDRGIFAMAEDAGFENVLRGRLLGSEAQPRSICLADDLELVTEHRQGQGEALVGLRANDLMLALDRPTGLSARNILPATIGEIRPDQGLVSLSLHPDVPNVMAQVTEQTLATMALSPGRQVFLVFKATACRVYGLNDQ